MGAPLCCHFAGGVSRNCRVTAAVASVLITSTGLSNPAHAGGTVTPIKHVIIVIGENRGFDHIFATYKPVHKNERVLNLLSKKIVNPDGSPGPNYRDALQYQASDTTLYQLAPAKVPYVTLPAPLTSGPSTPFVCQGLGITTGTSCVTPANVQAAKAFENGLPDDYYQYLLTGGTGQKPGIPDARINYNGHDATHLPPGPFQITSKTFPYDAYTSDVTHRFFQMWQQLDCAAVAVNERNGWGCKADLFPWVEVSVGAIGIGANGAAQPAGFNNLSTGEGATSMGFYNVQQGDAPYFKELADTYTMADNYHQGINGGTGANHIMIGTGDAMWFSDGNGTALVPPNNGVNPKIRARPFPAN